MRRYKPLPADFKFESTLAGRLRQIREFRTMSTQEVAKLCRFKLQRVEELEGGMENWLSAADRQLIAKALSVEPSLLKEVELRSGIDDDRNGAMEKNLARAILAGQKDLPCPYCGGKLISSVEDAFDIEDRPFRFAKAFCENCTFLLR